MCVHVQVAVTIRVLMLVLILILPLSVVRQITPLGFLLLDL